MNIEEQLVALGRRYRNIRPTAEFQELGWRVLAPELKRGPARGPWIGSRPFQFLVAFLVMALVAGSGTVYAAQWAKPSDPLFPVKLLSERVAVRLAPTSDIRQTVAKTIMDRRLEELKSAEKTDDPKAIVGAIEEYRKSKEDIVRVVDRKDEHLKKELEKHEEGEPSEQPKKHDDSPRPTDQPRILLSPSAAPTEKPDVKGAETESRPKPGEEEIDLPTGHLK